jgi:hypothetical protein
MVAPHPRKTIAKLRLTLPPTMLRMIDAKDVLRLAVPPKAYDRSLDDSKYRAPRLMRCDEELIRGRPYL